MDQHLAQLIFFVVIALVIVAILGAIAGFLQRRGPLPYERVGELFSAAERSFLGVLEQVFGKEYRILGKVRLSDIIRVRKGLSGKAWAIANTWILRFVILERSK